MAKLNIHELGMVRFNQEKSNDKDKVDISASIFNAQSILYLSKIIIKLVLVRLIWEMCILFFISIHEFYADLMILLL